MTDQNLPLTNTEKVAVFDKAKAAGPQETIDRLVEAGVIDIKPWWQSLGINASVGTLAGSVAVVIAAAAELFGFSVGTGPATLLAVGVLGIGSAVATWLGRVRAVQPISMTQVTPNITLERKP